MLWVGASLWVAAVSLPWGSSGVCSEAEPTAWHGADPLRDTMADAASARVVAGAGIQLEAGRSNPLLAKSAEFD